MESYRTDAAYMHEIISKIYLLHPLQAQSATWDFCLDRGRN